MGFPLEYSELSEYFDAFGKGHADPINPVVEGILRKYDVKTVLDFTCGTGSQVFYLLAQGYDVIGVDLSEKLLAIARDKALRGNILVQLLDGDMRASQVGVFDAVITIGNAVGHLTKQDFEQSIKNIHSNLKKGGLYIFDIFNLSCMTEQVVEALKMDTIRNVGSKKIHNIQNSRLDRENGLLISHDYFSVQEAAGKIKEFEGDFALQIYSAQEIVALLSKNGFEVVEQLSVEGKKFLEYESLQVLTIARKA